MNYTNISLKGKVAIVTGASRGIGEESAIAFAQAGAAVVLTSRKQADLDHVAESIRKNGGKCLAVASHVAKTGDSQKLVERAMSEYGRIDILMNNAGTNPYFGPLMDVEEWAWDITMNVNLKGLFFLTQLAARIMKKQETGSIINISSVGGLRPGPLGIYQTAKAAVVMLTQLMAKEWGQYNIRVNAIAPGIIKTRLAEALWKDPALEKEAANNAAMLRVGDPDDVAGVALFLASDLSKHVTGQTIVVDGGELMGAPAYRTKTV
jgi:dehydrogenase/reductase SDR family member 4